SAWLARTCSSTCPSSLPAITMSSMSASTRRRLRRRRRQARAPGGDSTDAYREQKKPAQAPAFFANDYRQSVQLLANLGNALGQEVVGDRALHRLRQDGGSRRDRGIGSGSAHIGERLRFGERNLVLGSLGPPGHEIFHLGLGLGCDALGIHLRRGDDVLGLPLGAGATGLVLVKQIGCFLLEAAGI